MVGVTPVVCNLWTTNLRGCRVIAMGLEIHVITKDNPDLEQHLRLQILSLYPVFQSLGGAIQHQSSYLMNQANKNANLFPVDCNFCISRIYITTFHTCVYAEVINEIQVHFKTNINNGFILLPCLFPQTTYTNNGVDRYKSAFTISESFFKFTSYIFTNLSIHFCSFPLVNYVYMITKYFFLSIYKVYTKEWCGFKR